MKSAPNPEGFPTDAKKYHTLFMHQDQALFKVILPMHIFLKMCFKHQSIPIGVTPPARAGPRRLGRGPGRQPGRPGPGPAPGPGGLKISSPRAPNASHPYRPSAQSGSGRNPSPSPLPEDKKSGRGASPARSFRLRFRAPAKTAGVGRPGPWPLGRTPPGGRPAGRHGGGPASAT